MKKIVITLVAFIALVAIAYLAMSKGKHVLDDSERPRGDTTYITLSQGITRYELAGADTGDVVLFVHGGTIPLWTWDAQVEPFIDAGFSVLRYTHYGRGYSDRPRVQYDRTLYRTQIADLLKALNISEPIHLIGHSFGADIAADFAAAHPEKIKKLVIVSPLFNCLHYDTQFRLPFKIIRIPVVGNLFMRFVLIPKSISRARKLLTQGDMPPAYERLFMEQVSYEGFERSLLSAIRTNYSFDYRDAFENIEKNAYPVMLMWGNKDTNVPKDIIDDVRAWMPRAEYIEFDGIGHQPNWEIADKFSAELIEFLSPDQITDSSSAALL